MRKFWGMAAGAALIVLGTGPGGSVAAAEPKAGTNLQVLSWNMCDVTRWGGCTERQVTQKVALLKQKVQQNYVQAMLLQEVCQSTLKELTASLGPAWSVNFTPYHWSQKGALTVSPCETKPGTSEPKDPNDDVGTAIVVAAGLSDPVQYPMVRPSTGLVPPFQCATATYFEVRLCNVHNPRRESDEDFPTLDYRDDHMLAIRDVVEDYPKVVFGGDFNTLPPDSGPANAKVWPSELYSTGKNAAGEDAPGYDECNQTKFPGPVKPRTGVETHDTHIKLDYVFSNLAGRWCIVEPAAAEGTKNLSDHRFLIYSVEVVPAST
ncbi:endonuclease/exonuclease/phosphatase family protein [Streptomyces sp. NPDC006544]|uniref:endonuclease/exonuclease/phosphatase family protein n=1 Tax=Streptomyces sp. NPDC006544 TaxID=3154583 RepID=UPI0033AAC1A4